MITGTAIRKNQYYDSAYLMGINNRLSKMDGIVQTAVLMGSDANREVLADLGFNNPEIRSATANDLVVGVIAETQAALDAVLGHLDEWLTEVRQSKKTSEIHTLDQAFAANPATNMVVISVPGEFAARETRKSLEAGKHVFLFSDNVSVADEVALKQFAREQGLLVMGPDCGTSIIGGVGIGFANAVRRGSIGVIAGAGTGLQEFTCMVHNAGYGISHAIGTGGRDLSDEVGGITTLMALESLEIGFPLTEVIAILSKPVGGKSLTRLIERINQCKKPIIGCFLGNQQKITGTTGLFKQANIIDDAVQLAIQAIGGDFAQSAEGMKNVTPADTGQNTVKGKYLRGVFAGGTFCYQSQQILQEAGIRVYSNAPLDKKLGLSRPDQSRENTIVDMGDEFYMVGRPHPMIDGSQRAIRIVKEAKDPDVAILFLDFILGYNSSMDPVGELVDAIQEAQQIVLNRRNHLEVVASVCGTDGDSQEMALQVKMLKDCGVKVFQSNARATSYCARYLSEVIHA